MAVGTHPAQPIIAGERIAAQAASDGLPIPVGHRLATLAERPDLEDALDAHNTTVWPAFMLHDSVAFRLWSRLHADLAAYQLLLLDPDGAIAAAGNSAPLAWDGTDAGLPAGWDDRFERTMEDLDAGRPPTALGALQIVVQPGRQGGGLSGIMLGSFRAHARLRGLHAVIACVRPTHKERYPLVPIERYAGWLRADGLPFDPWIRLHVRSGGRRAQPSPASMRIEGSVADWEAWTGMEFPESGDHVVPRAASLVAIDREADRGVYLDPNVWIVHRVG